MTVASSPTTSSPTTAERIEELGRIIMAYSEVTEKLQQSHEELTETVSRLKEELSEKQKLLERKNRLAALGEMAAGLAHEIRNPLGGIQLYASLLATDVADRPESVTTIKKIVSGVKRLEALVSQVLNFSRDVSARTTVCDMVRIVRETAELASAKADASGVSVVIDAPATLAARVDAHLMQQLLLNLTLNAVEAVGGRGRVLITLQPADKQFALTVSDTGEGIPADALDRIFNPFFTTKDTGTGLGLSIVHRIVEAHGGTITAHNAPTGGAVFQVRV